MIVSNQFKQAVAEFFNTHIEDQKMTFDSFDAKVEWCGRQINEKTAIGRAAIMFAMSKTK
ncbi:hypothetical protein ZPAH1_orf00388 [Aeromonas phage ZPAH1]|nr:hypothetical protein ASwh1_343 [Aeromonas phage Aswh_1]QQG34150.1 hypothetical protein ZPAH1_orf00388 [Aeromonas phage ZPAH1]